MDFFERQDLARRKTKRLVVYFGLAVALIILAVYLVVCLIFARGKLLWDPSLFGGVAGGTLLVIGGGTLFKVLELRSGGAAVAAALGGRPVPPQPGAADEQRLVNVVEEMAIASGTAVPVLYVLDEEKSINAFAAGFSPADASIGVTRGSVAVLSRDELQGVIAHEFSHILNGDMRLNLRLMGILHGIVCLTVLGRVLLRTGSRHYRFGARSRGKGGNPLPLLGLALIVIGSIGVFFGKLIKSAVSRQREFLADAAAVQFTRNPGGLAGALKKIGGLAFGSRLAADRAEEASHLFFSNGLSDTWLNAMSTHPPLAERIRLLDPAFDGNYPAVEYPRDERAQEFTAMAAMGRPETKVLPPVPRPAAVHAAAETAALLGGGVRAEAILPSMGNPQAVHLAYARNFREALPDALRSACGDARRGMELAQALLLGDEGPLRERQLAYIGQNFGAEVASHVRTFHQTMATQPRTARLPLIDLLIPALRQLAPIDYTRFREGIEHLVLADAGVDLFEFALLRILERHLDPHFTPVKRPVTQYYALPPLIDDCATLLWAVAWAGHHDPERRSAAYDAGLRALRAQRPPTSPPLDRCDLQQVEAALKKLAEGSPRIKKVVLNACVDVVAHDGVVAPPEAELLRAIADSLDCPIPPLVT